MAQVTGIGGIFFRAKDPAALAAWYAQHLGTPVWQQHAGPTVFAPFPKDTEYFGAKEQSFMINLRVEGLDGLVARLRDAGIEVTTYEEHYPNGRFARLHDPEGSGGRHASGPLAAFS